MFIVINRSNEICRLFDQSNKQFMNKRGFEANWVGLLLANAISKKMCQLVNDIDVGSKRTWLHIPLVRLVVLVVILQLVDY